jgi:hypothetical protein
MRLPCGPLYASCHNHTFVVRDKCSHSICICTAWHLQLEFTPTGEAVVVKPPSSGGKQPVSDAPCVPGLLQVGLEGHGAYNATRIRSNWRKWSNSAVESNQKTVTVACRSMCWRQAG